MCETHRFRIEKVLAAQAQLGASPGDVANGANDAGAEEKNDDAVVAEPQVVH